MSVLEDTDNALIDVDIPLSIESAAGVAAAEAAAAVAGADEVGGGAVAKEDITAAPAMSFQEYWMAQRQKKIDRGELVEPPPPPATPVVVWSDKKRRRSDTVDEKHSGHTGLPSASSSGGTGATASAPISLHKRRRVEEDVSHLIPAGQDKKDRALLNNSKVIAEEKSKSINTAAAAGVSATATTATIKHINHIPEADILKSGKEWLTDAQIHIAMVHQIEMSKRRSIPSEWPKTWKLKVFHPQPLETLVRSLGNRKNILHKMKSDEGKDTIVMVPVNIRLGVGEKGNHWVMFVVDGVHKSLVYWDPLGLAMPPGAHRAAILDHFAGFRFNGCLEQLQSCGFQCGVWIVFGFVQYYAALLTGELDVVDAKWSPRRKQSADAETPVFDLSVAATHDRVRFNEQMAADYRKEMARRILADIESKAMTLQDLEVSD